MLRLALAVAALFAGVSLMFSGPFEFGLTLFGLGALGVADLGRRIRGHQRYAEQERRIGSLAGDIEARIARGEPPDGIARAFEGLGLAPIVLLQALARHVLQGLGHGARRDLVATSLTWLASSSAPVVPIDVDLLGLDPQTTLHAMTAGVTRFADDESGTVWHGTAIASRQHFIFITDPHHESLTTAFVKGFAGGWLPEAVSLPNLGRELWQSTRTALESDLSPKRIADFVAHVSLAGSLGIPWRDVVEVAKLTAPDDDKKVELVITTAPNVRHRFRLGTGLKEQFVEDWVDVTRTAAALEGVFLPPLS